MQSKLKEIKAELRWRRHQPFPEQGEWLAQIVGGYLAARHPREREGLLTGVIHLDPTVTMARGA